MKTQAPRHAQTAEADPAGIPPAERRNLVPVTAIFPVCKRSCVALPSLVAEQGHAVPGAAGGDVAEGVAGKAG
jgi:hypothetical protein